MIGDGADRASRFLFVVWSKARPFEERILDEISSRFKVVRSFEVVWPRRHFTANLAAFYGWKGRFCWWNKARRCGRGPFLAIEVEDPSPKWERDADMSGHNLMLNRHVCDLKKMLRAVTGHSNRIHASMTREETAHELAALASIGADGRITFKPMAYTRRSGTPISMSFCISDSYSQHLAVVLTSILLNNPRSSFVFHVLHRGISDQNQSRIRELEEERENGGAACPQTAAPQSVRILFHKIDSSRFAQFPIPPELEHVTQEMYYRYLLPEILADEDRTIYSDVDVLCVGNLRQLWETDLKGNVLAAVLDDATGWKRGLLGLSKGDYFCSGLLVMDLAAMRRENSKDKLFEATKAHAVKLSWPDQDVINIVFDGRILVLPEIWNCASSYNPFRRDVRQWHFQGSTQKPWCNIWKNSSWVVYLKYLLKSPYRANFLRFVWGHVKGFFYFKYTKKRVTRYLICGIRIWKRKESV